MFDLTDVVRDGEFRDTFSCWKFSETDNFLNC